MWEKREVEGNRSRSQSRGPKFNPMQWVPASRLRPLLLLPSNNTRNLHCMADISQTQALALIWKLNTHDDCSFGVARRVKARTCAYSGRH